MRQAAFPRLFGLFRAGVEIRVPGPYRAFGKRAFDLVLVLASAPLVLPLVGVLWLVVRRDGGPGFYAHRRVGAGGRAFLCWKLRSMCVDAEARLADLLARDPTAAREWARDCKLKNDPRITRFGRFLRRSSLDELPQLLNVFRGEMSLVGPRPVTEEELARYGVAARHVLSCRPGLTGLWQVSGRNGMAYADRVRLDCAYARRHDLWLDLRILLRTVLVVLRRTGL